MMEKRCDERARDIAVVDPQKKGRSRACTRSRRANLVHVDRRPGADAGFSGTTLAAAAHSISRARLWHDLDHVIRQADRALYKAKDRGKARIVLAGGPPVQ